MAGATSSPLDGLRGARKAAAALLVLAIAAFAVAAPAADASVSRSAAAKKALAELGTAKHDRAVIVFGLRTTLRPGTLITQSAPSGRPIATAAGRRFAARRQRRIRKAGVRIRRTSTVMRVGRERVWFFYEDRGPHQNYEHPGHVVLVGAKTGRVRMSRQLRWAPLVDGRQPPFLRSARNYESDRFRVFDRPWSVQPQRSRARTRQAPSGSSEQKVADALAAERSCAFRISDTLGDFLDFGRVDQTRARLGLFFEGLEKLNAGFVSRRYTTKQGQTPVQAAQAMIDDAGCRDLFVYTAGAAARTGDAGIVIGMRPTPGGNIEWHVLTAGDLAALVDANPGVTFKFLFDVPYSARVTQRLNGRPNVLVTIASSGPDETSFLFVPEIAGPNGLQENTANPDDLLEFTNAVITGLVAFASSDAEVDHGLRQDTSMMVWMLTRAMGMSNAWTFSAPVADLKLPGSVTPPGTPPPPPPPPPAPPPVASGARPMNHNPVPTTPSQATQEDVPRAITLTANDPDGDPLTFSIVDGPDHGDLTGSAPNLTYTPDQDFHGSDSFEYLVADDRGGSATGTVNIVVTPGNDAAAVVTTSGGSLSTYVENGSAVVVDSGLEVEDRDSTTLEGATVAIADGFRAGDKLVFANQPGIAGTYDSGTGVLTLTGTAPVSDYEAALRSVEYESTSEDPLDHDRVVEFTAEDGDDAGVPGERGVSVQPVNDGPVNSVPGSQSTDEDVAETLTLSAADPDAGSDDLSVSLDVDHGALQLATTSGLANTTGNGTQTVTFDGTVAEIAAALDGLQYTPSADYAGADTLTFATDDLGNNGSGGAGSDTDTVAITVDAVNDAPVNTVPGAQSVDEDAELTLSSAFSVADADAATDSVTVTLSAPDSAITVNSGSGVTGNGTGSVQVAGAIADVNTRLSTVKYQAASDVNGSRTLTMLTDDGGHNGSGGAKTDTDTVAMTIESVNDAPVLGALGGTLAYTEDDAATAIDTDLTLSDVDSTQMSGATVAITGGHQSAQDRLALPAQGNAISGSFDTGTGVLTLSGSGTLTQYRDALRAVTYENLSDAPDLTTRTVSFQATDAGGTANGGDDTSDAATRDVSIAAVNDAPQITTGTTPSTFTEGGSAAVVDGVLTVADADTSGLAGATVKLTTNYVNGEDSLAFVDTAKIDGDWVASTGTLTLTPVTGQTPTVADFQNALRAVTFANTSEDPSGAARTVEFRADDGQSANNLSDVETIAVDVDPVNDAPTAVASGGTTAYTEDGSAAVVDSGVTLGDVDDTTFDQAQVRIVANDEATDVLSFTDTATIDGEYSSATRTLTLNGTDTVANYQAALRSVTFHTTSDAPGTNTRNVEFLVRDGADYSSATGAGKLVSVTAANDAPVVTASGGSTSFTENGAAATIDGALTVTDGDSSALSQATVTITGAYDNGDDELVFADTAKVVGAWDAPNGRLTLSPAIGQTPSPADFQAALRTVQFDSTSQTPGATRTISFRADDGAAANNLSNVATKTIAITEINSAPVLTTSGGDASFTEDGSAVTIDGALTLSDADSPNPAGATVTIVSPQSGDELQFGDTAKISGNFSGAVLTLSPVSGQTPTVAEFQSALRSVQFDSTQQNPTASRTISFQVDDGASVSNLSNVAQKVIAITALNDSATVTTTGGDASFTEDGSAVAIDSGLTVADADDTELSAATVAITSGFQDGEDDLAFADTAAITGNYSAGTLTLTAVDGSEPVSAFQSALRTVQFDTTSQVPGTSRTISFRANDGDGLGTAATRGISISDVNDGPSITKPAGFDVDEGATKTLSTANGNAISVSDADAGAGGVELTLAVAHGDLTLSGTSGLAFTAGDGTDDATMTFTGTVANVNAALNGLQYSANSNDGSADTLEVDVDDKGNTGSGGSLTDSDSIAITINAVNEAPVHTVPGTQTFDEDTTRAFSTGNGNTISVADGDAGSADLRTTLTATNGTLSITTTGLDFSCGACAGTGTADTTMTFEGTLSEINAALQTLVYSPNQHANGPATIAITTNDLGNSGAGGAQSTTDNVALSITAVNDAPQNAVPGAQAVDEDTNLVFSNGNGNELSIADADAGSNDVRVTLAGTNGVVSLGSTAGLSFACSGCAGNGTSNATMTFEGTVAEVNAALASVTFRGVQDHFGSAALSLTTSDKGHTGSGGTLSDTDNVSITVNPVNDAPTAGSDSFVDNDGAIGNTALVVNDSTDGAPTVTHAKKGIPGDILANDDDVDGPGPLTVTPGTFATANGGSVVIEEDGDFTFHPEASASCSDASDSFSYTVEDSGTPELTATGTVTIELDGCAWYVRNTAAAGGAGTSSAPFDTLAEGEAASAGHHTVFVLDGDNTSTGYDAAGYQMESGERLIGEHEGLTVDPDHGGSDAGDPPLDSVSLQAANPGAHPTITGTDADVVSLDDGNELRGLVIDPHGTGGGISGGSGDTGGTFDDVSIVDNGTAGQQAGLELSSTSGTFNLTSFVVANKATGVLLSNAGTVDFGGDTSQVSISSDGGPGLNATGTNLNTSQIDDVTVTNSTGGGVLMTSTPGTTVLGDGTGTDLSLTTSGSNPAVRLDNAGTVTIDGNGTDSAVNTNGGPALDVNVASGLTAVFDTLSSNASSTNGIRLDHASGTVSGGAGTIQNATGTDVSLGGNNSGDDVSFTYDGTISDATGTAVSISQQNGGTKDFNGSVTGGGVALSTNNGGTTRFDGGLALSTGASAALSASSGGTLAVTNQVGGVNTLTTTTGTALNVASTTIHDDDLTFRSIASNGAANGIVLSTTSNANGRLVVAGNSGACTSAGTCTGGAIQSSSGAGISLNDVPGGASLTRMAVTGGQDDGIRVTSSGTSNSASGLSLDNAFVSANGNLAGERGLDADNLRGQSSISSSTITGSAEENARIDNDSGTLDLKVTSSTFSSTSTTLGGDGLQLYGDGTALMRSSITNSTFTANRDDAFQMTTAGGTVPSPTMHTAFNNNTVVASGNAGSTNNAGVVITPAAASTTFFQMSGGSIKGSEASALILNPLGTAQFDATVTGITIGAAGEAQSGSEAGIGLWAKPVQNSDAKIAIRNSTIQQYAQNGMYLRHNDGTTGTAEYTVTGNTIVTPNPGLRGIYMEAGATATDTQFVCADIGGAGALANSLSTSGGQGLEDIFVTKYVGSTFRFPGLTNNTDAGIASYLANRNAGNGLPTAFYETAGGTPPVTGNNTLCAQPTLPTAPAP
jgi:Bacterial Ig domain